MKIKIKETSVICPKQEFPNHHLYLSSLDLFNQSRYNSYVYIYSSNNISFDLKVLKDALKKVLVEFYPVAGRMGRDNKNGLQINCNGDGVLFIEAETDSTIQELGDLMLNEEIPQLIPTLDYSAAPNISSLPLFVSQVTKFKCGGLALGTQWHHILSDGSAYIHFMKTWCEIARGLPITNPPFLDRSILRNQISKTPKFQHFEYEKLPSLNDLSPSQINTKTIIINVTLEQLNALKFKADQGKGNNGKPKYSSYEILTAHIWRCVNKARGLSKNQATKLNIAVDARSRLKPPLPTGYFGNAVFMASPTALSSDIVLEPLTKTVERIREAIYRMDDEFLRSAMDYMDGLDDFTPIIKGPQHCGSPNLSIISWMRFPFYSLDFGIGKPICMRTSGLTEGKVYIAPTPNTEIDRNWQLIICLESLHIQLFKELFYDGLCGVGHMPTN